VVHHVTSRLKGLINGKETNVMFLTNGVLVNTIAPPVIRYIYKQMR